MAEHPTTHDLDAYRRRVLAPADFVSVHRHVTDCPRCAEQSDSPAVAARDLSDLRAALLSAPDEVPYHLSSDEVAAYVRGRLDEVDLEIAESHLNVCSTCLAEVERRAVKPARRWLSLPATNWWQPWRVAAVVSFSIVVVVLAIWLLRTRPVPHTEQVAVPANQSSPQIAPVAGPQSPAQPGVSPDAEFALILNDGGHKITLDKQGTLAGLERLPSQVQQRVRTALQTGRLEHPSALAQLNSEPSKLLSNSGNGLPFRLVGPVGQAVLTAQPTFRWRALTGAQSYTVTVTDTDLNEVANSPPLSTTEWRIAKPLKEGGTYSWQVTALKDGVRITSPVLPAPQAKFKVIDSATAEMLQQARHAYPDAHLTVGVLYAEAGLFDEAEQELRVLVRNNPGDRTALKLLQSVRSMRASHNRKP